MSAERPRVSIVVCVYNAERFLPDCLASVFNQTVGDWELVCVDDGSTDGSLSVLRDYASREPRMHVHSRGGNFGLLSARKFGVAQTSGEYLMFLDNDDELMPDACQALLEEMDRTSADIVQFNTDYMFESGEKSLEQNKLTNFFSVGADGEISGAAQILKACFCDSAFSWNVWNKMYRTELVKAAYAAIADEYMIMPEDAFAFFQVAAAARKLVVLSRKCYRYRVGAGVSTATGTTSERKASTEIRTICHSISELRSFCERHADVDTANARQAYEAFMRRHVFHDLICLTDEALLSSAVTQIASVFSQKEIGRMLLAEDGSLRLKDGPAELLARTLCEFAPERSAVGCVGLLWHDLDSGKRQENLAKGLAERGIRVVALCDGEQASGFPYPVEVLPYGESERERELQSAVGRNGIDSVVLPWRGNLLADKDFLIARLVLGKPVVLNLGDGMGDSSLLSEDIEFADAVVWKAADFSWLDDLRQPLSDPPSRFLRFLSKREDRQTRLMDRYYDMMAKAAAERSLRAREMARLHAEAFGAEGIMCLRERFGSDICGYRLALVRSSPYFNADWYLRRYPDVASSGIDPVEHYVNAGWKEGRNPSEHFDTWLYLDRNPWLRDVERCPLVHFLEDGLRNGNCPICSATDIPLEDYRLVAGSDLFDAEFYSAQIPGGVCIGDPVVHYCIYGWRHGLVPSSRFNPEVYRRLYPDLRGLNDNLLLHYLRHGRNEGRHVYPFGYELIRDSGYFDAGRYVREHGAELGGMDPLTHYCLEGWRRGYAPSEKFSESKYASFYVDLRGLDYPLLYHYLSWGKTEGRHPFAETDELTWRYPDGFDRVGFESATDKILVVTHQLDFTGVPVLSLKIAELFPRKAAVISPSDGPLVKRCLDAGVPVVVDASFFVDEQCCQAYAKRGFSFALFNTIGVVRAFLWMNRRLPSLLWVHDNVDREFLPADIRDQLSVLKNVYATSAITRRHVKTYAPMSGYLPYPVVDVNGGSKASAHERLRFGIVARIEPRKGQDIAVEAFRSLPDEIKAQAELLVVGSSASNEFVGRIRKRASGESIEFRDAVSDSSSYQALYDEIDVFLCPSRTDPMPLVVMDAMMHGCPVVLSDQVGQSAFVEDDVNGYVFRSEDVAALRNVLLRTIESKSRFAEMSAAVRKTFEDNFEAGRAKACLISAMKKTGWRNVS